MYLLCNRLSNLLCNLLWASELPDVMISACKQAWSSIGLVGDHLASRSRYEPKTLYPWRHRFRACLSEALRHMRPRVRKKSRRAAAIQSGPRGVHIFPSSDAKPLKSEVAAAAISDTPPLLWLTRTTCRNHVSPCFSLCFRVFRLRKEKDKNDKTAGYLGSVWDQGGGWWAGPGVGGPGSGRAR